MVYPRASIRHKRYMLERAVNPINKRRDTACAATSTTVRKHNVMTILVILKSGPKYTRGEGGLFFRRIKFFFLVRSGLNAGWFLVNSHYKRLCASLCTFETVQEIKK